MPDQQAQRDAIAACALLDELLKGYGAAYEELKQGRGAVDFDDLELLARQLLRERANVRTAWSERFELLMVDEFQDTNARQLGILEALDRGNLFTVGDELQSIYGFRHADVRLFRERRAMLEEHGGNMLLTRNFRSREPLLDVVNAVFAQRFAPYTPLVAGRVDDPGEPEVELLLTNVRGWDERPELAREIAAGLPRHSSGARRRHGCWPSGWPSWWRRATRAQVMWWCYCGRPETWRCSSARCSCAACARWRRLGRSGATSRSAI